MTPYEVLVFVLFGLWVLGMVGTILFLRHLRLHPPRRRARYREEPDTWAILDEIDHEGW